MMENPEIYSGNNPVDPKTYGVIAWNSAFMAADITSRGEHALFETLKKEIKGVKDD